MPRLVEGLVGKKVVGAAAGDDFTLLITEAGELYTCGYGGWGQTGHGANNHAIGVPRLVQGELTGKKVVGAAAGDFHFRGAPSCRHCNITVLP